MKQLYRWLIVVAFGLFFAAGSVGLLHAQNDQGGVNGASYLTTVDDSAGNFASRGVITLHADHTMSVIDSGQGGPIFFFSSQLGSWKANQNGGITGKTIDFDFPPNAGSARLDYSITFAQQGSQIIGTITLTTFPLTGDPLGGGGTVAGTFTFTGQLITP